LVGKIENKRLITRLGSGWKDNIKVGDKNETCVCVWREREREREFIWFLEKVRNLLTS